ncbi:hypothetical protein ACQEVG_18280 [Streptomyces sp. CA-135486]|uniref:hypothetical protein n=1 Tax=Streptomyces sp. CA-135486 TaxID=3240049 RepID=UPI003D93EAED
MNRIVPPVVYAPRPRQSNLVQAAEAGSQLGGGGIVHGHSAAVFPAAVVATPLLLDIAQRGHPAAQDTALGLLDEALSCYPHTGYTRVAAPDGTAIPICCAIAHHLRDRTDFLVGLGKRGKSLLADAAAHWRFEIRECVADSGDTAAFGILAGCLPDGVHAVEMHLAGAITVLSELTLGYRPRKALSKHACGCSPGIRANCRQVPCCFRRSAGIARTDWLQCFKDLLVQGPAAVVTRQDASSRSGRIRG